MAGLRAPTPAAGRRIAWLPGVRWTAPNWLTAALVVCFGVYLAWRYSSLGGDDRALIDDIAMTAAAAATTIAAWLASRRCADDPRTTSAWRWIAVAFLFPTMGLAAAAGYEIADSPLPSPSVADLCWLSYYVSFPIGLLRFPMRANSRAGIRRMLIDTITISIGTLSIIWFIVLGPTITQGGSSTLSVVVASSYPVGDVLVIFGATYVLARVLVPATRFALSIVGLAIVAQVASDGAASWLLLHGEYSASDAVHGAYMAVFVLYVLGAASQRPVRRETLCESARGEGDVPPFALGRWLPYVVPAVVFGLLIGAQFGSDRYLRVGLAVCAAGVAGLVLARQFLAQQDLVSAQGELSYQAMHDALTDLPNRALVLDRAEQLLARARRQRSPIAALFIDLDGFKYVNDTFGHAAGDELLKVVAGRLAQLTRDSDTVGRIGGDEFVVLLDSLTLDVAPELVAERMLEVLRRPARLDAAGRREVTITASIGVAMATRERADLLLRNADMAMYEAKTNGKNSLAVFESSMQTAAKDRLLLEMDLREAVSERQFFLLYQPTFDLRTETVIGVEALIRWRHPTRGVVAPGLFVRSPRRPA